MNKIFQIKWSEGKACWVVTSELSSSVPSRRRVSRGGLATTRLSTALMVLSALIFHALTPTPAFGGNVLRNVQVEPQTAVEVVDLRWVAAPLEVGQTLSAVYQFNKRLMPNQADQSRYLYDYLGSDTAGRVADSGQTVAKSGEVPGRVLTAADVGRTLELSVQARNSLAVGNTQTIDTRVLSGDGVQHLGTVAQTLVNGVTVAVALEGEAKVSSRLTATPTATDANSLPEGDLSYTYAWKANGSPIADAHGETFTLTAAQAGKHITGESDAGVRWPDLDVDGQRVRQHRPGRDQRHRRADVGPGCEGGRRAERRRASHANVDGGVDDERLERPGTQPGECSLLLVSGWTRHTHRDQRPLRGADGGLW